MGDPKSVAKPYPRPPIYGCPQWGARPVNQEFETALAEKHLLHHTADQNTTPSKDKAAELEHAFNLARSIQADHMDINGWSDTGQQFTISRGGIMMEGRHGSIAAVEQGMHVVGAECEGYNHQSGGTEHEGNFMEIDMPDIMWNASIDLHCWIVDRSRLDSGDLDGHRQHISTACPGDKFFARLPQFRSAVHARLSAWRKANP